MLKILEPVKSLIKIQHVTIDNSAFRLHYKATASLLLAFSVLVTATQFVGDPIACIADKNAVPEKVINNFCWISSTFTLPNRRGGNRVGQDVVQPGVASWSKDDDQEVKYHQYYQWVCFALFLQAIMFYAPRYLWKNWEGQRMKGLLQNLQKPTQSAKDRKKEKKLLVDYFLDHFGLHNLYAFRYFICEALNLVNAVGQIYLMDWFLNGEFTSYGPGVVKFTEMNPEERSDPLSVVFPKVTKCTFHKYGPSGSIVTLDSLCLLPLNILNEKLYVFMWFWFLFLSGVSGLMMGYRVSVICSMRMRKFLLYTHVRLIPPTQISAIAEKCFIGDLFILCQLANNLDPLTFKEFISDVCDRCVVLRSKDREMSGCERCVAESEGKEISGHEPCGAESEGREISGHEHCGAESEGREISGHERCGPESECKGINFYKQDCYHPRIPKLNHVGNIEHEDERKHCGGNSITIRDGIIVRKPVKAEPVKQVKFREDEELVEVVTAPIHVKCYA